LLQKQNNNGNKSNYNYFDPITFESIDLTKNKNEFPGDSREYELPSIDSKKLDFLVLYKIIKNDSSIILTTNNENFPDLTIKLTSNQLELMDSGYILNLEKEIIVKDNNNVLKSGWAGFRWQNDIYYKGRKYGNSVTIGRTYDFNKIYINIKTFINTNKINLFLISVN
ncbi:MAG TPA: hypothetical protein VNJ50_13310, partial [Gelidibacter sp.]|uniref:hypothetical protein n=1 Tax=Gelidibacter sp. TaxID=2018083 RepID=UPI002CEBA573